jgi:hypothetical protein
MPVEIQNVIGIINFTLTAVLLFMGIQLLSIKADMELLKARLFLKPQIVKNMRRYSICAGGFLVLHVAVHTLEYFRYLKTELPLKLTEALFIIFFLLLTYEWYKVYKMSIKLKK